MTDVASALGHAGFDGFARVREIGPWGMITLRAAPDLPGLAAAVQGAVGLDLPERRRIRHDGPRAVGWMAPDEWLLILPYDDVTAALERIATALAGQHHLAVDVSDARAVFRIEGDRAAEVLMKLAPVDVGSLAPDELRRTRAAQVACAFWRDDVGVTLVAFRSVAVYVMGLLTHAAQPGSELHLRPALGAGTGPAESGDRHGQGTLSLARD
jgi:sarcosine oxidase subunit gamma